MGCSEVGTAIALCIGIGVGTFIGLIGGAFMAAWVILGRSPRREEIQGT